MDSSAMMTFKTCPRKYQYRIVLGYTVHREATYFAFGSAYHKFREMLELYTMRDKLSELEAFTKASEDALIVWSKKFVPSKDKDPFYFLNEERLKASMAYAFKHWLNEKKLGKIKVIATEQPFAVMLEGESIPIAGRADQVVKWNNQLWGRDFKTTSKLGPYYIRSLEPNDQFTRYTWAESKLQGTRVLGQIVEVLYNSAKEGPKIEIYTTQRTEAQIKQWEKEHHWWMKQIRDCDEQNYYPMNEKGCFMCEYHQICKIPNEAAQVHMLTTQYKYSPWDCMKVEQD